MSMTTIRIASLTKKRKKGMKREKLCLLSRNSISPPNPRLRGGSFLLHHGGFSLLHEGSLPLRNGGSLPPHGGSVSPPRFLHRFSFNHSLSLSEPFFSFPCLPFPNHHRTPTTISAVNPHPFVHEWILFAGFGHRSMLRSSPPPCRRRLKLHCSNLMGGLFSQLRTFALPSPPAARPPAEPPPLLSTRKVFGGFVSIANPLTVRCCSVVGSAPPNSPPARPPPKPPWPCLCFNITVFKHVSSGFVFLQVSLLMVNLGIALKVFEKMTHKDFVLVNLLLYALWRFFAIVEIHVTNNYCKDPPSYQTTSKHEEKLVNLETNNSRPALAEVKKFIRNWIGTKTLDSHLLIASARVRKLLIFWLFGHCNWLVLALMLSKQFMCCVLRDWRVFSLSEYFRLWMGNGPTQLCYLLVMMFQLSYE